MDSAYKEGISKAIDSNASNVTFKTQEEDVPEPVTTTEAPIDEKENQLWCVGSCFVIGQKCWHGIALDDISSIHWQYHHFLLGFIVNAIVHVHALRPYKHKLKNYGETRTTS
jgi:hypothetical protein